MINNRVFINEQGLIEIIVDGDQTVESVQAMADEALRMSLEQRNAGKRALILDNLLHMGNVPPEARRRVVELVKSMDYEKLAMVGKGTILRLGTNLMLQATSKGNRVKYFEDYDKAVLWLKLEQIPNDKNSRAT
jgi:UDP-N-acetylmuramyl pentapeptide synthase